MSRKPPLTMEQHRALGAELRTMRSRLVDIYCDVARAMPKDSVELRRIKTATDRLDEARSKLEDRMFRDHPDEGNVSVYYGPFTSDAAEAQRVVASELALMRDRLTALEDHARALFPANPKCARSVESALVAVGDALHTVEFAVAQNAYPATQSTKETR